MSRRAMIAGRERTLTLLLAAAVAACASRDPEGTAPSTTTAAIASPSPPAPTASYRAAEGSDPFVYAKARRRAGAVPARFTAKLPQLPKPDAKSRRREPWPADAPPRSHLEDAICFDLGGARATFMEGLEAAAATAAGVDALSRYRDLLRGCHAASRCAWVAGIVDSSRPLLVRRTVWPTLVGCDAAYAGLFDRADTPPEAKAEQASWRRFATPESSRDALDGTPRPSWPEDVAKAACDPADTDLRFGLLFLAHPTRRAELAGALAACLATDAARARLGDEAGRRFVQLRLEHLAHLDTRKAHEAARSIEKAVAAALPTSDVSRSAKGVRDAVMLHARFAAPEELEAEVRKVGFDLDAPEGPVAFSVIGTLERYGRSISFDPETGQWPNEHDHLARQLAHAIGKDLAEVFFEEVPPPAVGEEAYVLRACFDGLVLEVDARARGDWYDVDAVLGLVNSVLVERRSERRVAMVFMRGNEATAVAGPAQAIRTMHAAGLLELVESAKKRVEEARDNEQKLLRDIGATPLE